MESAKRRRRKCLQCGHVWTTYELILEKEQVNKLLMKGTYRKGKPWTEQDDDELQFLFEDGMTMKEISEELGRTEEAVDKRIRRIGLRKRKNIRQLNQLLENKDLLKVLESFKE
jgi:transcriptional regulator NrdR family protein